MSANFKQLLADINTFIFDMDGVLTDGSVTIMPDGEHVRTMNIKDGYALQLAVKKGYRVVIISGANQNLQGNDLCSWALQIFTSGCMIKPPYFMI